MRASPRESVFMLLGSMTRAWLRGRAASFARPYQRLRNHMGRALHPRGCLLARALVSRNFRENADGKCLEAIASPTLRLATMEATPTWTIANVTGQRWYLVPL